MLAYVTVFGACKETGDSVEYHGIIKAKNYKEADKKITICTTYVHDNLAKVYENGLGFSGNNESARCTTLDKDGLKTISKARFCTDEKDLQALLNCCEQVGFTNGATLAKNLLKVSYKVSEYGSVYDSALKGNFKRVLANQIALEF